MDRKSNLRFVNIGEVVERLSSSWVLLAKHFSSDYEGLFVQGLGVIVIALKIEKILHNGAGLWNEMRSKLVPVFGAIPPGYSDRSQSMGGLLRTPFS